MSYTILINISSHNNMMVKNHKCMNKSNITLTFTNVNNIISSYTMELYKKIMEQNSKITTNITKELLTDLLKLSQACHKLLFYNNSYEICYNLYSKEMMKNKIHLYLGNSDIIEFSYGKIRNIFNDTILKISDFYPAYNYMTCKDMNMVKNIFDKFNILLLPNISPKLILKEYSFASLCCVCMYFDYMHYDKHEIERTKLQKIIQSACDRKRTEEYEKGNYNENMQIHDKAKNLSFILETERDQQKDYMKWYNNLTSAQQKTLQEYNEIQQKIKEEL